MGGSALRTATLMAATGLALATSACDSGDESEPEPIAPATTGRVAAPGEPPTAPPAEVEGQGRRRPEPVVIASGETALGRPFEFVLYGTTLGPCFMTLFPHGDTAHEGGGACGRSLIPAHVDPVSSVGSSTSRESSIWGFVDSEVERVEIAYGDGSTVEAEVGAIPEAALRQAGGDQPIGVFIAWLPDPEPPAEATLTAFGGSGDELGSAEFASGASATDAPPQVEIPPSIEALLGDQAQNVTGIGCTETIRGGEPPNVESCDVKLGEDTRSFTRRGGEWEED